MNASSEPYLFITNEQTSTPRNQIKPYSAVQTFLYYSRNQRIDIILYMYIRLWKRSYRLCPEYTPHAAKDKKRNVVAAARLFGTLVTSSEVGNFGRQTRLAVYAAVKAKRQKTLYYTGTVFSTTQTLFLFTTLFFSFLRWSKITLHVRELHVEKEKKSYGNTYSSGKLRMSTHIRSAAKQKTGVLYCGTDGSIMQSIKGALNCILFSFKGAVSAI